VDSATSSYRSETDPLERFLQEVCAFGPELQVTKGEMHDAYVQWCADEDEEPKGKKAFTGAMNEKGVVKNFYGDRNKKERIWKGVTVRSSDPQNGDLSPSVTAQKSCKTTPGESERVTLREDSGNFSIDVPREERFSENGCEVSPASSSVTEIFTTPHSWTVDGHKINYMPEGE
jgi:phage/plasmid-associated DNA primase